MFNAVPSQQLLSLHVNCQIRPTGRIRRVRLQLLISPLGVWGANGRRKSWGHAALPAWTVVVVMHAAVTHCSVFWVILPSFTCGFWGVCFNHIQSAELRLRFSHFSIRGVQRVHIQWSAPYGKTTSFTPPAALSQIRLQLFFLLLAIQKCIERFCTISKCGLQPGVPELWWTHPQNMQANKSSLSWRNFPRQPAQKALRWYSVSQSIRQH